MKTYKSVEYSTWDPQDPETKVIERKTIPDSIQDDFIFEKLENEKVTKSVIYADGLKRMCFLATGHTLVEEIE